MAVIRERLEAAGLNVQTVRGKHLDLAHGYVIEVEGDTLFKLLHEGSVVAPFDEVDELIGFIKQDMALNGWA